MNHNLHINFTALGFSAAEYDAWGARVSRLEQLGDGLQRKGDRQSHHMGGIDIVGMYQISYTTEVVSALQNDLYVMLHAIYPGLPWPSDMLIKEKLNLVLLKELHETRNAMASPIPASALPVPLKSKGRTWEDVEEARQGLGVEGDGSTWAMMNRAAEAVSKAHKEMVARVHQNVISDFRTKKENDAIAGQPRAYTMHGLSHDVERIEWPPLGNLRFMTFDEGRQP